MHGDSQAGITGGMTDPSVIMVHGDGSDIAQEPVVIPRAEELTASHTGSLAPPSDVKYAPPSNDLGQPGAILHPMPPSPPSTASSPSPLSASVSQALAYGQELRSEFRYRNQHGHLARSSSQQLISTLLLAVAGPPLLGLAMIMHHLTTPPWHIHLLPPPQLRDPGTCPGMKTMHPP